MGPAIEVAPEGAEAAEAPELGLFFTGAGALRFRAGGALPAAGSAQAVACADRYGVAVFSDMQGEGPDLLRAGATRNMKGPICGVGEAAYTAANRPRTGWSLVQASPLPHAIPRAACTAARCMPALPGAAAAAAGPAGQQPCVVAGRRWRGAHSVRHPPPLPRPAPRPHGSHVRRSGVRGARHGPSEGSERRRPRQVPRRAAWGPRRCHCARGRNRMAPAARRAAPSRPMM